MSTSGGFRLASTDGIEVDQLPDGVTRMRITSEPLGVLRQSVKVSMLRALRALEADRAVRALVVTGMGRAFSVGSDIREFQHDVEWQRAATETDQSLNRAVEDSRLPVIAACNGFTFGGGCELALACDIRIAAQSAKFGLPEVRVGSFASAGGTQRLPQIVGSGRALYLLLTGRELEAREALQWGLVQEVHLDDELDERAIALARELAALPASAVRTTKQAVVTGLRFGRAAGHQHEDELSVALGTTPDAIEGQSAFLEKRTPSFNRY